MEAPAGLEWVTVDPSYPSEMGTTVTLPLGSKVLGVRALRRIGADSFRSCFCELMVTGEIPDRIANLRKGLADDVGRKEARHRLPLELQLPTERLTWGCRETP